MASETRSAIYWKGELIGYMGNPSPDMWYIEGKWQIVDSETTSEFLQLTSYQSWADFHKLLSYEDFIWVGLDENKPNHVFVAFVDEFICLRLVTTISPPENW